MKTKCFFLSAMASLVLNANAQVAAYSFAGTSLLDQSGNGHHGAAVGSISPATDRFGNPECAIELPGTATDYVAVPFATAFDISPSQQFSISCWYKDANDEEYADLENLFTKWDDNLYYESDYYLALYDINKPLVGGSDEGYSAWAPADPPYTGSVNDWNHAVGIYDNGTFTLYVNGVMVNQTNDGTISQSVTDTEIRLGYYYSGLLDDMYFYDTALNPNEVALLYAEEASCDIASGIAETADAKTSFEIFPNPASDVLNIVQTSGMSSSGITITDAMGEVVMQCNLAAGSAIDVSELAPGVYFISPKATGAIEMQRFVKQ